MQQGKSVDGLLPALLSSQPTGGFGEERQSGEQDEGRDSLNTPGDAERGGALNALGAAVGDQVHDENTPFDGPLLDTDDATTDAGGGKFGEVDADLGGSDTDYGWSELVGYSRDDQSPNVTLEHTAKTADDTSNDQMSDILGATLEDSADNPDDRGDDERHATADAIRDETSCDGTGEGARGHGGGDLGGQSVSHDHSSFSRLADQHTPPWRLESGWLKYSRY